MTAISAPQRCWPLSLSETRSSSIDNMPDYHGRALVPKKKSGSVDTGDLFELSIEIPRPDGGALKARRIVIRLTPPTHEGDTEMAILTNLPNSVASSSKVANLHRKHKMHVSTARLLAAATTQKKSR